MSYNAIDLFNAYDLQPNPYVAGAIDVQEVVKYCEARFRAALQAMLIATEEDQAWMFKTLFRELVSVIESGYMILISLWFRRNAASPTLGWQPRSGDLSTSRLSFGHSDMNFTSWDTIHSLNSNRASIF
jgi:hypothetical protein